MATIICLIRHGETDWNAQKRYQGRQDIELNNNGKIQATQIAEKLKKVDWDVIVSSPLKRAKTTADIIGEVLNVKLITTNHKFIERDYGEASGVKFDKIKDTFPDGVIPGKEEDYELGKRVFEGLVEVVNEYKNKNILLISHGAVINSLLKTASNRIVDMGETNIKNACINIIKHYGDRFEVEMYNSPKLY